MSPRAREKTLDYYMSLPYKVELTHDEDGWFAKVIDLPGCMTWTDVFDELQPMIEDAKRGWIEDALEYGDPVPEPRTVKDYSGKVNLRMPKSLHRDLARQAEDDGVSLNQLMVSLLARGAGSTPFAGQNAAASPRSEEARIHETAPRDWREEVRRSLEEYEALLQEEDLTPLASSRIVTESTTLLKQLSNELSAISGRVVELSRKLVADTKKRRYPPRKLMELETAFDSSTKTFHALSADFHKLEDFCSRAIEEHKARFGNRPERETDQGAYSAVEEAETILQEASKKVQRLDE